MSLFKDQVFRLVQQANLSKAIDIGLAASKNISEEAYGEWSQIKARFDKLRRDERIGILTYSEASRERNVITHSVLEMAGLLDKPGSGAPRQEDTAPGSSSRDLPKSAGRILFLASSPGDAAKLQLEHEFAKISWNLQNSQYHLFSEWAVRPDDLQRIILTYHPEILHFSGHGTPSAGGSFPEESRSVAFRKNETAGGLIFQNKEGAGHYVDGIVLEELFGILVEKIPLRIIVLNACYSEPQAEAINRHIPFVIGMKSAIRDYEAIQFSSSFYMALAQHNDVEFAFKLACNQIRLMGGAKEEIAILHQKNGK